jgi:hypothetical protein
MDGVTRIPTETGWAYLGAAGTAHTSLSNIIPLLSIQIIEQQVWQLLLIRQTATHFYDCIFQSFLSSLKPEGAGG